MNVLLEAINGNRMQTPRVWNGIYACADPSDILFTLCSRGAAVILRGASSCEVRNNQTCKVKTLRTLSWCWRPYYLTNRLIISTVVRWCHSRWNGLWRPQPKQWMTRKDGWEVNRRPIFFVKRVKTRNPRKAVGSCGCLGSLTVVIGSSSILFSSRKLKSYLRKLYVGSSKYFIMHLWRCSWVSARAYRKKKESAVPARLFKG